MVAVSGNQTCADTKQFIYVSDGGCKDLLFGPEILITNCNSDVFFFPSTKALTPAGCPTIQPNPDPTYPETASA